MANIYTTTSKYDAANGALLVTVTCNWVDTNETAKVLVDKSTFTGLDGAEPSMLKLLRMTSNIQGMTSVTVKYDSTTDKTIAILGPGSCYLTWSRFGGLEPTDTGSPGDIVCAITGGVAGGSFTMQFELQAMN